MRKSWKVKGLIGVLICALILPSCKKETESTVGENPETTVWGMPGTEKVYEDIDQNSEYYAKYKTSASVNMTMAKGEYEGSQIIISAGQDVTFDFESCDLVCGQNKIPKESVEIFVQKYVNVQANYDVATKLPVARYPDALVPMQKIKEANENVVYKGENQGFYIRVKTAIDQPVGLYTGSLTLTIADKSQKIPVSIQVEDVVVSEENHLKSAFINGWYTSEGELDSSQEMLDNYNNALLEYRLCGTNLMYSRHHREDISTPAKIDAWVEKAYEYMQNPLCSTINMPYELRGQYLNEGRMENLLQAIFDYSLEKNYNMFEKLIWYGGVIDEPRGNGIMEMARTISHQFNDLRNRFADKVESSSLEVSEEFKNELIQSIRIIPNILTEYYDEELANAKVTFCPLFQYYNSEDLRQQYEGLGERWWYGCVQPKAPYPTYHIDDTWLSARVLSWLQAEYNVVGNLYWSTDLYARYDQSKGYLSIEEYYEGVAARFTGTNGEGFLFYPGKKYGVDGPLASMRLEAIRDGMEEYEILYTIKQNYEKINQSLDENNQLDFSAFVNSLTSEMHSEMVISTNTEEFNVARAKLFETAKLTASTDYGLILSDTDGYGNHSFEFVANKSWTVKNKGEELTPDSVQGDYAIYRINTALKQATNSIELSFIKDGQKIDYSISLGGKVTVRYGNSLDLTAFEKGSIQPTLTVNGTGLKISIPATTRVDIGEQDFAIVGANLSYLNANTKKIVLHIRYNGNDKPVIRINGKFANARINNEFTSATLNYGDNIIVVDLSTRDMATNGLLEKLIFCFYKLENETTMPAREFRLDAISFYE